MTSSVFLARFKDKSSTLTKSGIVDVGSSKPVELASIPRLPHIERDLSPLRSQLVEVKSNNQLIRVPTL